MVARPGRRCWLVPIIVAPLLLLAFSACAPAPKPEPKAAEPAKPAAAQPAAPAPTVAELKALPTAPPKAVAVVAPAGKRDLIIVQGTDIEKLDPHMSSKAPDIAVNFNNFDNLIDRGPDLKMIPALATEWKTISDTTWQFKLRKGVQFHNGEPFDAEDVKFSVERIKPKSKMGPGGADVYVATYFQTLDRVEIVDQYTVNVHTKGRDPLLPNRLAFTGGQMIPKDYYQKVGADEFNRKPIGTGPLKFVEWIKDDRAVFEVNKEWWGGKLDFDRVIFKPMPEAATRVAALLKGEADIVTKLPPDDVERVNKSANAMAVGAPYTGLYVLSTIYKNPYPWDNKYFHQALSLATDRVSIVRDLWRGQGVVPTGIYCQGQWNYDPKLPPLEYNPAKAKEMLQKTGYKGEEIIIETTVGYLSNDKQMSEAIAAMWREVGINVKIETIEYSVRAQKGRDLSFKGTWWQDPTDQFQDPDSMPVRQQGPGGKHHFDGIAMWADGEWDKLVVEARQELDQEKRRVLYEKAHKIWLDWMPWVPVIQPIESFGIQRYIEWEAMGNQDIRIQDIKIKR